MRKYRVIQIGKAVIHSTANGKRETAAQAAECVRKGALLAVDADLCIYIAERLAAEAARSLRGGLIDEAVTLLDAARAFTDSHRLYADDGSVLWDFGCSRVPTPKDLGNLQLVLEEIA